MDVKPQSKRGSDVAGRLLQKLLMPIVATAASAAASYAAKKGPQLLDQKVVPKVRELMSGTKAAGAGDVAERLTERARSVAGDAVKSASDSVKSATGGNGHRQRSLTSAELERRRQEREKARAERRKATR